MIDDALEVLHKRAAEFAKLLEDWTPRKDLDSDLDNNIRL